MIDAPSMLRCVMSENYFLEVIPRPPVNVKVVYYESINRELKTRPVI